MRVDRRPGFAPVRASRGSLTCGLAAVVLVASTYACDENAGGRVDSASRGSPSASFVDTLVDVGDHRLRLEFRPGTRDLTILFEAGGGAGLDSWATVPERLASRTTAAIVTYDRAGLGRSDLGPEDLTPGEEIEDVREALARLDLPSRTIVVGHSYGAMLALAQAEMLPGDVVGLVLVDPMNPRFAAREKETLASTVPDLPPSPTPRDVAINRMAATMDSLTDALLAVEPTLEQPMIIVSAGHALWGQPALDSAWVGSHAAMAAAAPHRRRIVSEDSGHDIPADDPDAVVDAILSLVEGG